MIILLVKSRFVNLKSDSVTKNPRTRIVCVFEDFVSRFFCYFAPTPERITSSNQSTA